MRDKNGVNLPGYPIDDVVVPVVIASAADIPFSPTEDNTATNVQAAIENAGAIATDQSALIARYFTPYVTGGSSNAYTITPSPAITAYTAGQGFIIRPDRTNTGAATLNVNGIGAVNIKKTDTSGTPQALVAGDIYAGREFFAYDDGSQILISLGRDYPIRTSNSNGDATVFPDGTLICRKSTLQLTYTSTVETTATWTFPVAFSTATGLSATANLCPALITSSGNTVAAGCASMLRENLLPPIVGGGTGTTTLAVRVHCKSASSPYEFTAPDVVYVSIQAIGRWF
jgi:hypothetical protein